MLIISSPSIRSFMFMRFIYLTSPYLKRFEVERSFDDHRRTGDRLHGGRSLSLNLRREKAPSLLNHYRLCGGANRCRCNDVVPNGHASTRQFARGDVELESGGHEHCLG